MTRPLCFGAALAPFLLAECESSVKVGAASGGRTHT